MSIIVQNQDDCCQNSTAVDQTTTGIFDGDHVENIGLDVLLGVVMGFALYILVVLLIYERSLRVGIAPMLGRTIRGSIHSPAAKKSRKIGRWLRILCVISAALCVCTCINDLIYYNVQMRSDAGCTAERNIGVCLLSLLDATIYMFLWLRQYIVFENLRFERKITRYSVLILKWTTLFFIIGLCLVTNALLACCRRYEYNPDINHCEKVTADPIDNAFGYLWTAGSISLHCTLVAMFVFPLIRLQSNSAEVKPSKKGKVTSSSRKRLLALVRRCLIVSILCVLTDVFVMLFTEYVINGQNDSELRHFIYNLNVLVNITLIVISFKEWRQMLLPWTTNCGQNNEDNSDELMVGSLQTVTKSVVNNPDPEQ
uniref:uncharacterized protein LOC120340908 n=1 Tax=Styela clava TaxID=7725 RepID=UPI00193ACAF8|nr:uncharacterized protein LOC120340908 [Styela clava]